MEVKHSFSKTHKNYKRFIVFAWDMYYPLGGFKDYQMSFDTFDEAVEFANSLIIKPSHDNYQILDKTTMEIFNPDINAILSSR